MSPYDEDGRLIARHRCRLRGSDWVSTLGRLKFDAKLVNCWQRPTMASGRGTAMQGGFNRSTQHIR